MIILFFISLCMSLAVYAMEQELTLHQAVSAWLVIDASSSTAFEQKAEAVNQLLQKAEVQFNERRSGYNVLHLCAGAMHENSAHAKRVLKRLIEAIFLYQSPIKLATVDTIDCNSKPFIESEIAFLKKLEEAFVGVLWPLKALRQGVKAMPIPSPQECACTAGCLEVDGNGLSFVQKTATHKSDCCAHYFKTDVFPFIYLTMWKKVKEAALQK